MKNWESLQFKTEVNEGQEIVATFRFLGNKEIEKIYKSCGCTDFVWQDGNILKAWVSTGFVKSHIHPKLYEAGTRKYIKSASLNVIYTDGTSDRLTIEATVKERKKD